MINNTALEGWPEVTISDYRESVESLLHAAEMAGTSGARAASILLRSLYNGTQWHMNLTDLCLLGDEYYTAALITIRGRKELMCEPHKVIDNGDEVFSKPWDRWEDLKVQNF